MERRDERQIRALELANVPERVDHRSHQLQGIEQEPNVYMGPSATAMVRRAEQVAAREGRAYEPVTAVGQHNAGVVERAGLRQYIERGTEWLRDMGQRIAGRSEEHTSELQSLMRISYAVFCLKKQKNRQRLTITTEQSHTN